MDSFVLVLHTRQSLYVYCGTAVRRLFHNKLPMQSAVETQKNFQLAQAGLPSDYL